MLLTLNFKKISALLQQEEHHNCVVVLHTSFFILLSSMEESANATSAADTVVWTQNHSSIGQGVVASFQVEKSKNKRTKNFFGKVVSFAKESKVGANDQLYHIEWEDGDEQDYDGDELAAAIRCYNKYSLVPAVPTTKTKMADEGQSVHPGAPEAPPKYVTRKSTL